MMEGFKHTDIGLIPDDWHFGRIDEYFTIQQGKSVSKTNRIGDNQKPFLRTSNLLWGKVTLDELDFLHFSKEEEEKYKLLYNDLLVCEGGDIGRTAIWENEMNDIYFQNHLHRVRAKVNDIDPNFVMNWMQYAFRYGKIYFGRGNITTIPNLSKSRLSELAIPKPPLPEQRKIAYVLSTVQKAIEQQDKLIRTTTELKKALMQKLFTEGLPTAEALEAEALEPTAELLKPTVEALEAGGRKLKQTEIGLVPESWEVVTLGNYLEETQLKDPTKKPNDEFIYVDVSSVSNELLKVTGSNRLLGKEAPSRARKLIQTDDVIFATVRPTLKRIAKITLDLNNQICSTGFCVLKPAKSKLDSEFLFQYLQTDAFIARIEKLQRGANYPAVRDKDVKGLKIPLPQYSEQVIIGKYLKTLDKKKNIAISKKQTLNDLFKTLLHELMTGKRRVHEIEFQGGFENLSHPEKPKPEALEGEALEGEVLKNSDKTFKIEEQQFNIAAKK